MRFPPRHLNTQLILLVTCILLATGATSGWVTASKQSDTLLSIMRGNSEVMTKNFSENAATYLVLQDYAGLESLLLKSAELPDIAQLQVCELDGDIVGNIVHVPGSKPRAMPGIERITPPATQSTAVIENGDMVIWEPVTAGSALGWLREPRTACPGSMRRRKRLGKTRFSSRCYGQPAAL